MTTLLNLNLINKEMAERSLSHFIRQAWQVIEPGTPYIHNWHIRKPLVKEKANDHGLLLMEVSDAHNLENIGLRYTEVDLQDLYDRSVKPASVSAP